METNLPDLWREALHFRQGYNNLDQPANASHPGFNRRIGNWGWEEEEKEASGGLEFQK